MLIGCKYCTFVSQWVAFCMLQADMFVIQTDLRGFSIWTSEKKKESARGVKLPLDFCHIGIMESAEIIVVFDIL